MRTTYLLILLTSFWSSAQNLSHLAFGPHDVAFQSSVEFDHSRPARNKKQLGRAIQVNIWYPAGKAQGSTLTLNDYIYLIGKEDSLPEGIENDQASLTGFLEFPKSQGANMDLWNALLSKKDPMKARRGLSAQRGDFPFVLLIHGSAVQYALMGEYLASHGMIAVNVPYKGYLQNTFDVNVLGMETEMRDMEYALDVAVKKLGIIPKSVGLIGMSFGGQSAVGIAARNPQVKGVVSLDGGIGSSFGPQLLSGHPFFNIEKVNMPIMHLYNPADTGGNIDWFDVCQYTDRYLVSFKNMDHNFFGIMGSLDKKIPHVLGPSRPRPGDNDEAILLYTKTFLEEVFASRPPLPDKITNLDNQNTWLSGSIESVTYRERAFSPIPLDRWQNTLATSGVDGFTETHRKQKEITAMPITDGSYRALFFDRLSNQDKPASLRIAELYTSDFPGSALAQYYRGRALQLDGKSDEAKAFFTKSLDMMPTDQTMTVAEKEAVRTRIGGFLKP